MRLPSLFAAIFFLIAGGALFATTIGEIEYFFDTDPGPGNGTQVYTRDTVELDLMVDTSGLSPGFHTFHVRAKNAAGQWGLPQRSSFYIPLPTEPDPIPVPEIAEIEYFFNEDPGEGNGTPIYTRDTVSIDELIPTAGLSPGFHTLHVRAQDTQGDWGLPQRASFYIPLPTEPNPIPYPEIAGIEYFFDADPGQGSGIPVYTRDTIIVDELVSTASLSPGFHTIHIRAVDTEGDWGLPQRASFYIPLPTEPAGANPVITQFEYFVDDDPGSGQGTVIPVTPGSTVTLDTALTFPGLEHGNHLLWFRARNSDGFWSLPVSNIFSDGIPGHLTATYADGNVTLTWEDVYTVDTYKVYSKADMPDPFVLDTSGTFGESSWTAPAITPMRFFHVTSVYDE